MFYVRSLALEHLTATDGGWTLTSDDPRNMLNTRLIILKLLKRLCQVFAALATSSAQRLRILVSCFRRFVTKIIHGQPRFSTAQHNNVLACVSSAQCPSILPLHAGCSTPDSNAVSISTPSSHCPTYSMPTPSVLPQASPEANPQANINPQANTRYSFAPFIPTDVSRYENRPPVYVLCQNSG